MESGNDEFLLPSIARLLDLKLTSWSLSDGNFAGGSGEFVMSTITASLSAADGCEPTNQVNLF